VRSALVLGTLADPTDVRVLGPIPNMAPNDTSYDGVTQVRWLDTRTLVYVAERFDYRSACRSCPLDTLRTGLEVLRLDLSGATPLLRIVPGTMYATSVVAGESADVIYYTLIGETRIHRRVISSGADSVVHAFGAGIARDVTVVGTRLVAVVGGRVSFTYDSVLGHPLQTDSGGPLYLVDLAGGGETVLSSSLSFRRPMLSPTGKQLVAQATSASLDLWLFDLP
jgi:hypothetical protein